MYADKDYIVKVRRELHKVPELTFELPKTLAIVRKELEEMGIPYSEEYGISSIVATLNEGVGSKTIAIRADMDALPIQEETDLEFKSTIPGQMHACGHDCHTAMLLGTAKKLKEMEKDIKCCVKFFFQASEEGPSGARRMCESGAMEGVDTVIACHVGAGVAPGVVTINKTYSNAGCRSFVIDLYGKSSHVSKPHLGVDAIAMAVRVYSDIQLMRARELDPMEALVIGIGQFHGGAASNIVCDHVTINGTIRTGRDEVNDFVAKRIEEIAKGVAADMGGSATVEFKPFNPAVRNNHGVADAIVAAAQKVVGAENIQQSGSSMGAEDFAYFMKYAPGAMFGIGVQPEGCPVIPLHNGKLVIDENGLDVAPDVFIQFILDQMEK